MLRGSCAFPMPWQVSGKRGSGTDGAGQAKADGLSRAAGHKPLGWRSCTICSGVHRTVCMSKHHALWHTGCMRRMHARVQSAGGASCLEEWQAKKASTAQLMQLLQTYKDLGDSKSEVRGGAGGEGVTARACMHALGF